MTAFTTWLLDARNLGPSSANQRLVAIKLFLSYCAGEDQLAERLGITVRHVRRLVAEKRVPYLKVGQLVRFNVGEVSHWLDQHRRPEANHDRSA